MTDKKVMIVAGEASGDHHGAKVVKAMRKKDKSLCFFGIGGNAIKASGVDIIIDSSMLSVVGITEVIFKFKNVLNAMSEARKIMKTRHPDLLILIDYPDFNLILAEYAQKLGIKVLYYISPTVWAWRSGRIKTIKQRVDHMAVILPFELPYYQKARIPASFVGHPLLDNKPVLDDPEFEKRFYSDPVIGLLPGSRDSEIEKLLPVMIDAANIMCQKNKRIKFLISLSHSVDKKHFKDIIQNKKIKADFEIIPGNIENIFNQCSFIIAASGTVNLETALAGIPMVIVYKVSALSYFIGKKLINVNHISLVNLIPGKSLLPELIQDQAIPENIAQIVLKMLDNVPALISLRHDLLNIKKLMGRPGASERVADIALNLLTAAKIK
ncbi:Lipid-A-disaccharide synthase [Desulfonema limicola]|uniref:Lipid-A-disaccharide synthase n=1 Tax=Desulfonema limicola TaxID=45656 RepID=A0A975BAU8_9BACT|nr:lipid-A-disaccharide synthase [Desulfonema limicola]QTA81937.1 Lipid-A-disaccharide synthase [Desulfonema limicola]